jgi:hypothetical protein
MIEPSRLPPCLMTGPQLWGPFVFKVCLYGYSNEGSPDDTLVALGSDIMQSNRAQLIWAPGATALHEEKIERGARALFEFVFARTGRLNGKDQWVACDDKTKAGFRAEVKAVLDALEPQGGANYRTGLVNLIQQAAFAICPRAPFTR